MRGPGLALSPGCDARGAPARHSALPAWHGAPLFSTHNTQTRRRHSTARCAAPPTPCRRLRGRLPEEGDHVGALLRLLEAGEGHLGARDVLLRVLEVVEERVVVPDDALIPVGLCVRVALDRAGRAAEEAVQVGAGLGRSALREGEARARGGSRSARALGAWSRGHAARRGVAAHRVVRVAGRALDLEDLGARLGVAVGDTLRARGGARVSAPAAADRRTTRHANPTISSRDTTRFVAPKARVVPTFL